MSNVSLTIQFASVDEALVALAAFSQVKVKTPAAPKETPPPAAAAAEAKPPRKPRADRGQPRGPYKKDDDSKAPETAAVNGAPEAPTAAPAAEEPKAETPSLPEEKPAEQPAEKPVEYKPEELQKKLEAVFAKGAQLAIDVLARFGVTRLANLDKQHHAEFVALCDKVIAGGQP
jgi:hypothetical protein